LFWLGRRSRKASAAISMLPGSTITFEGLILRVAQEMGLHHVPAGPDNRAKIPTDPATLDRIKRAINDGRQELFRRMSRATCFRPRLSFTTNPAGDQPDNIDGDPAKYLIPFSAVAVPVNQWQWRLDTWGGHVIQIRHENDLAREHARGGSSESGPPRMMAIGRRMIGSPGVPTRRTQSFLWLYPKPDAAYTIEGQANLMYSPLVALDDVDPMGDDHAMTIVEAALYQMNKNHPVMATRDHYAQRFMDAVRVSTQLDHDRRPPSLGVATDPTVHPAVHDPYESDLSRMVSHVNGIPVL
jgi:hypothetical protein